MIIGPFTSNHRIQKKKKKKDKEATKLSFYLNGKDQRTLIVNLLIISFSPVFILSVREIDDKWIGKNTHNRQVGMIRHLSYSLATKTKNTLRGLQMVLTINKW